MFGAHRRWDEDLLVGVAFGDTIGYVGSNEGGAMALTLKLSTIARGALGLLLMLTCVFDEVVGIVRRNSYIYYGAGNE